MSEFTDCPKCAKEGIRVAMFEDGYGLACPLCDLS
jgi:hypothetical protein